MGLGTLGTSHPSEVGTEMIEVPENLTLSPYSHWAVYAKSSLVEQSTPASLLIYAAWKIVESEAWVGSQRSDI